MSHKFYKDRDKNKCVYWNKFHEGDCMNTYEMLGHFVACIFIGSIVIVSLSWVANFVHNFWVK